MNTSIRTATFGKDKYDYPKLESLKPSETYALTISPSPMLQKTSLFENYNTLIEQILAPHFNKFSKYTLRPEISTKSTQFHVHGNIKFNSYNDLLTFYAFHISKLKDLCTFTIKPITSYDWHIYVRKQRHIIKPYINSNYNTLKTVLSYKIKNW